MVGISQLDNLTRLSLDDSVIDHSDGINRLGSVLAGFSYRGPLLPGYGTRARELALRNFWHHDYNTLFRGAIAGLIKRIQSTPYEVSAPDKDGDRWQRLLMGADFGDWDRFISKLVLDYSRHDQGAFIELIAPGDPRSEIFGPIVGMANLESLRCYRTGNPEYPVVYYSLKGALHVLHHSRVINFVDTPDSEEVLAGVGDCALARCIAPVNREILMGRYIETFLDDKPRPGALVFGNISNTQVEASLEKMLQEQNTDGGGTWGSTLRLYGLQAENKPTIDMFSFSTAPEKFDYREYTELDVKEIALGIGLDIQDMWELTGGALGSGAQSKILDQKSSGKAIGRILKGLERVINRAFPDDVEMQWKYKDAQQDAATAQQAQSMATVIQTLSAVLTTDEQRRLLANTVEAFADVLIDENGQIRRYNDQDPKTDSQVVLADASTQADKTESVVQGRVSVVSNSGQITAQDSSAGATARAQHPALTTALVLGHKDYTDTADAFVTGFTNFVNEHNNSDASKGILRSLLRNRLRISGLHAYKDGITDGGGDVADIGADQQANAVATWIISQNPYIEKFVDELTAQGLSDAEISLRADMWVNKSVRAIYYAGLADAGSSQLYRWVLGPTEEHCPSCLALSGQVHKMSDYVKAGLLPGSSELRCHGYNCLCSLEPATGKTTGTFPGAKRGLGDRLMGWLRNLLTRGGR